MSRTSPVEQGPPDPDTLRDVVRARYAAAASAVTQAPSHQRGGSPDGAGPGRLLRVVA